MGLGRRLLKLHSEIRDSESRCVTEQLSRALQRPALIGMSAGKENPPSEFWARRAIKVAERMWNPRLSALMIGAIFLIVGLAARSAEAQFYAGGLGGVSTLSGDTSAIINSTSTNFSTYNPQNGLVLNGLLGKHFNDFFSIQGDYVWNRNALALTTAGFGSGSIKQYEETRKSSQQSVFGSALVYFRRRSSRIRPYLSVGAGWVHLSSTEQSVSALQGSPELPPSEFSANMIALRVPVGIDVELHSGWLLRYTFSETLSRNPISDELSPPGPHSLKNFQNLIGILRQF